MSTEYFFKGTFKEVRKSRLGKNEVCGLEDVEDLQKAISSIRITKVVHILPTTGRQLASRRNLRNPHLNSRQIKKSHGVGLVKRLKLRVVRQRFTTENYSQGFIPGGACIQKTLSLRKLKMKLMILKPTN